MIRFRSAIQVYEQRGYPHKKLFKPVIGPHTPYLFEAALGKKEKHITWDIFAHEYGEHLLMQIFLPDVVVESIARNMAFYYEVESFLKLKNPEIDFTKILVRQRQEAGPTFLEAVQNNNIINPDGLPRIAKEIIPSLTEFTNQKQP